MAEQIVLNGTDPNSVRKVIMAQAAQAVAWQVFTEQMGAWWPLAVYRIGKANAVDAIIEPHRILAVAGTNAATTVAPAIGVACWFGNQPRDSYCPGTSMPTFNMIRGCTPK
jgi:hypothetical protein